VTDGRIQWLLGLAAVLAVARFVIVPWSQWQVEQRQQLEVLTQRLDRSAGVVNAKEAIMAARNELASRTEAARKPFPVVEDAERFRLESQRQISAIAAGGNTKVVLFDWVLDGDAAEAGLAFGRVNAKLAGPLESLVAVHGALEGKMPHAAIREAKVEFGRGVSGLGPTPAGITVTLDLYYRNEAVPAAAQEAK
jgi:hypothetical protein